MKAVVARSYGGPEVVAIVDHPEPELGAHDVLIAARAALQALREAAALTAGQRVLIHAGAGGVGSLAIQIAKILGLWVATTTSRKNVEFVRGLGADLVIDYTADQVSER